MKLSHFAGALALAGYAVALAGCSSDPTTGDPTLLGVKFSFGTKANAQLVSLGAKLDAGAAIALTDAQGVCQIAAKLQPAVNAAVSLIPSADLPQAQTIVAKANAAVASPTCTDTSGDTLAELTDLVQTIVAIKAATGGAVTATAAASQ